MATLIEGVGKDAPIVVNEKGGKQSSSPYRMDLLPMRASLAVAKVLKYGADKYGDENWRNIPVRDHLNHALVHVASHLVGDTQDDHLEHAACRLLMALETALVQAGEVHGEPPVPPTTVCKRRPRSPAGSSPPPGTSVSTSSRPTPGRTILARCITLKVSTIPQGRLSFA
jgi:hypothetical protein